MLHHLIQTREFPVDDTTAIARSDTDETATVRLELGSVSTGTNLVWTVPNQNLDFTPDSGDFSAAGGGLPVSDATAIVKDPSTATKRMRIDVGAVSADTTRVLTMPDANVDLTVGSGTFNKYVHPDHTGDVTSSADGAQTIAADAVTYAKMQNVTGTDKFLGRDSSGAGVVEEIAASAARTILNVEDGATADQSNAEVKTAYEANADTNEFSNAEQTKLAGIEASADVTDTTNVNSAAATTVGTVTTGVWNGTDIAVADGGTGSSSASGARTNLGVAIGSNVQAFGALLDDFNTLGAASTDGEIIVATGAGAFAYESGATARTSLGLTIGTNVQAWDNDLDDLAALTPTKGKLIVGNGTDWINLSLGDDDEVLTADASETSGTKWAEAGGGGGGNCVLIASIDCDGSATADFTSGITSTYSSYKITYSNITFAGSYPELWMTFSDDGGSSWEAGTSYRYVGYTIRSGSGTVAGFVSTGTAAFKLLGTIPETDAYNCVSGEVMLYGLSGTTTWKNITACSSFNDNDWTAHRGCTFQGQFKLNTSAITGIRFQNDPGTYETGQFRLYGFTAA